MNAFKNIIIMITVTVIVAVVIVIGLSYLIDVKPSVTAQEKKFAYFRHEGLKIIERKPMMMSGLKNPVRFDGLQEKDYPPQLLAELAPASDNKGLTKGADKDGDKDKEKRKQRVSLVFIKDHARFAIVDGVVVKEGDMTKNGRIKMIKKEGILVKDNEGDKWLRIE